MAGRPALGRPVKEGPKPSGRRASPDRARPEPLDDEAPLDQTLTDRAYQQIEELITTIALPPGMVLGEQSLVQKLGIGRTPIREALQRLARDGLVTVMPRRGVLVSEINVRSHLRLLEARRVLERLIARCAAERATKEERATFAAIAQGMRDAAADLDDLAFMRLDRQFNALVATAARNEYAARSLSSMVALSRRFWYLHYQQAADLPLTANLHAEVCRAIAERNVDAAGESSDRLIDYIETFARSTINH